MGDRGPQHWQERLYNEEPDVFTSMRAGIQRGESLKDLHQRLELYPQYCSYSQFCKYVKATTPQHKDFALAGQLVDAMLQGQTDVPEILKYSLTQMVAATNADAVKATTLSGLVREISRVQKLILDWKRDKRDAELHDIKLRFNEARAKIKAAQAKLADASKRRDGAKRTADMESIAKLLAEADMAAELSS